MTFKEILTKMKTGEEFSLRYITYDHRRKKGGQEIYIASAILCQDTSKPKDQPNIEATLTQAELVPKPHRARKDPKHSKHFTRNIQLTQEGMPVGHPIKIHIPLIIEFNGLAVRP